MNVSLALEHKVRRWALETFFKDTKQSRLTVTQKAMWEIIVEAVMSWEMTK